MSWQQSKPPPMLRSPAPVHRPVDQIPNFLLAYVSTLILIIIVFRGHGDPHREEKWINKSFISLGQQLWCKMRRMSVGISGGFNVSRRSPSSDARCIINPELRPGLSVQMLITHDLELCSNEISFHSREEGGHAGPGQFNWN